MEEVFVGTYAYAKDPFVGTLNYLVLVHTYISYSTICAFLELYNLEVNACATKYILLEYINDSKLSIVSPFFFFFKNYY